MIAQNIILIITGIGALIVQMIYFLLDDRTPNDSLLNPTLKKYWHWAGGALHVWMGYAIGAIANDWRWGLLMGSLTWLLFDGFINSYALNREFWYIGNTSVLDIAQQKAASALHIDARLFSSLLKFALLLFSVLLLIPKL